MDGLPLEDQVNMNGGVPPDADALHVTGLPAVASPHVTVTIIGCAVTLTLAVPIWLTPLMSFAVAVTVWLPLVANVVV